MTKLFGDRIKLTNAKNQSLEFLETECLFLILASKFTIHEDFVFSNSVEPVRSSHIGCKDVDFYFKWSPQGSIQVGEAVQDDDFEPFYEDDEILVLSGNSNIKRTKYLGVEIRREDSGAVNNAIDMSSRGLFTNAATFAIYVPINIYEQLTSSIRDASLQDISIELEIKAFNLGREFGTGLSGLLIQEDEDRVSVSNLSLTMSNPHDDILNCLSRINRSLNNLTQREE